MFTSALIRTVTGAILAATSLNALPAAAQQVGDGVPWQEYYDSFKGKKVAFVPMALSFDMAQAYDGALRAHAARSGYEYLVSDPNWSVENAVQIAQQFIEERPDVMVIHPLDDKAFTRVIRKAQQEGIYTIFLNLRNGAGTDSMGGNAFIGTDFYEVGQAKAHRVAKICEGREPKQVALVRAGSTNAVGIVETAGFEAELAASYPDIELVSSQDSQSDPNKAKAIVETVLKQYPDLCAVVDQWEGEAIGIPPAIEAAGKSDQVKVITSGGGSTVNACDKVADGTYDSYFSSNIGHQTYQMKAVIEMVMQGVLSADDEPFSLYIDAPMIDKETMTANSCWDMNYYARDLK